MHKKPIVLIVDDKKDNRFMVKVALKNQDYELYEAVDGKEAIEKTKELNPDIILMDAIMPNMDGYEATKIIKSIEKFERVSILMITASTQKDDKIKALEYGVNDFISKPFDKQELIARCRSYINLSLINKQYIHALKTKTTNLPNKTALFQDIKHSINAKLVLFKIENFELLEEFYTNELSNQIEIEFAQSVPKLLGKKCISAKLYHINDGEFALLREDIDNKISKEDAHKSCEIFYRNTKDFTIYFDNYQYNINIIISFAKGNDNIFKMAKAGLNYAIKEQKNIVYANDIIKTIQEQAQINIKTINMIKKALQTNNIVSYFQPLYNNKTKEIEKYESLVRLIDEDGKVISPFFFLDIAKKGKYYIEITKQVLLNSFKALENTSKDISINLSATDIENDYIRYTIMSFLQVNSQYGSRIVFELLEDENIKDFNIIIDFIDKVKSFGVKIAIDDFGSGYSNFERLLDFKPDILKIDGSLIKNIDKDPFSRTIVETMYNFASQMGIQTVAEFVHSKEVLDIIQEIGINYTQGYYISEPKDLFKV